MKKEFAQATLDEIQKEIGIMQNELVPAEELEVVKNYLAGEFAGSLNTPFEIADRVRLMVLEGLDVDFYSNYIQRLRVVTAEEINQWRSNTGNGKSCNVLLLGSFSQKLN